MANVCAITDALAEAQYYSLQKLNRKFEALRRLAQQLEALGDLSTLIPNITDLVPVLDIDISTYTELASACPFLNLPAFNEASLEQLRREVITAYDRLVRNVLNHPWTRMGQLQEQLSMYQQRVNALFAQGAQYLQCLQAACQAAQSTGRFLSRVSADDITKEFGKYTDNFVSKGGQVLTESGQAKYAQAVDTVEAMRDLGSEVTPSFAVSKAAATAAASAPPASSSEENNVSLVP